MKSILAILTILSSTLFFSQKEVLELEEMKVNEILFLPYLPILKIEIDKSKIENLNPEDLAAVLQQIPGISIKNYGGLGGLKTISARGINGQHSGLILNGFTITNSQTGQIDLGTIPINNIESVDFSYSNEQNSLDAVSSFFNANNLRIETFANTFSKDTLQLRFDLKAGSFSQQDYFVGIKYKIKESFICLFTKYRQFEGNYPISFLNYSTLTEFDRINNDLKELNSGFSFGSKIKNRGELKLHFTYGGFDKGLPGPVILYNNFSIQRLQNSNANLNLSYDHRFKNSNLRIYSSSRYDDLKYVDSSFLNSQGYQQSRYFNTNFTNGFLLKNKLKNGFVNTFGFENNYSKLHSISNFSSDVTQIHNRLFNSISQRSQNFTYTLTIAGQYLENKEIKLASRKSYLGVNPAFTLHANRRIGILGEIYLSVIRTTRFPTFNELYYNEIGNINLLPEHANQFNLGTNYFFKIKNNKLKFIPSFYYNFVENKIVAIPTKNLFIWSIQNVGKVQILGLDLQISFEKSFNDIWKFMTSVNYSFQDIKDYSSTTSKTYKNQIAYSPKHLFNINFLGQYKNVGLTINGNYNGNSYAFNENISSNIVPAFYIFDANLFYTQKVHKSSFRMSFSIKNCLNSSYFYIRNYFMPGRNYLISLSYAFN
jgi:outer membrane receptor protein involved in Fe transport